MSSQFTRVFNKLTTDKKNALSRKDGAGRTLKLTFEGAVQGDTLEEILAAVEQNGGKASLSNKIDDSRSFNRSGTSTGKNARQLAEFILTGKEPDSASERAAALDKALDQATDGATVDEVKDKKGAKGANGAAK